MFLIIKALFLTITMHYEVLSSKQNIMLELHYALTTRGLTLDARTEGK